MENSCQRICLTPTRNESWIIQHFLAAAKLWTDHVIVADQGSTDGTRDHLHSKPGVKLVANDNPVYDEGYRQRLLLKHARMVEGKRILFGLDADETFSANCTQTEDWKRIQQAAPGTVLRFRWVNVLPGFKQAWVSPNPIACGFVDDGAEHQGNIIHSPRVPNPAGAPVLDIKDFVVLHFQFILWDRMVSKHRWYQAWEHQKNPNKGALEIFRGYNHMYGGWNPSEICDVKPEWLEGYDRAGIDFRSLKTEAVTWWDQEVLNMLHERGPKHFRKIALWDKDWNALATQQGKTTNGDFADPRSVAEKISHHFLKVTQKRRANLAVRAFERWLRMSGW